MNHVLFAKNVNNTWDSDVLPCNHTAHTRCFRRYLFQENVMSCPACGPLEFPDICRVCLQTKENHDKDFYCDTFDRIEQSVESKKLKAKMKSENTLGKRGQIYICPALRRKQN